MNPIIEEFVNQKDKKDIFNKNWWKELPEEMFAHVFRTVAMIEQKQNYRTMSNVKHARLYSNLEILGVYTGMYAPQVNDYILPNRLSLNVIKSCVDTVTSKLAKQKPRPLFLTDGADFKLQKKAKMLTQYIDGAFDAGNVYKAKQESFLHACVFGTGAFKVYKDTAKKTVCGEQTIIEEILVDDADGLYGKPRSLYQRRLINKDVLKEMVPKKLWEKIDEATNALPMGANAEAVKDLVRVIEAWHLPSGQDADDGVHIMCVDTCTLYVEKWNKDYFPFVFDRWSKRLLGFYGMGIAEELTGLQLEVNKILRNIQLSQHLFAVPRVMVENSSQVNTAGITNDIAQIIKYSGPNTPIFHTPSAMAPDVYNHLWMLVQKAYEITGVSQLSASSSKPAGLNSGAALREYQDIESDRFQIVGQRYEESFLEIAKMFIDQTKELEDEVGNVQVKVSDSGSTKTIKFKDVDMEETKYLMRVFPASILPTQPAGRMQKIIEYTQAGFFDKETAMDLMDFPDIKASTDKIIAPRRLIFKMLDQIVEDKTYQPPEPFFNLQLALTISQNYYMNAKIQGLDEETLELIRTFIKDCMTLLAQAQPQPQAQNMAAVDPMAQPQAAPTSDLIPV